VAAVVGNAPLKFRRAKIWLAVLIAKTFRLYLKVLIMTVTQ